MTNIVYILIDDMGWKEALGQSNVMQIKGIKEIKKMIKWWTILSNIRIYITELISLYVYSQVIAKV